MAVFVVAALFGAVAIVLAMAAWRLSSGPVSLGFLSPYLHEALQGEGIDAPYTIAFEDTFLVWADGDQALDIRVTDMRIADPEGDVLLAVPEASIGIDGGALLRGRIAPASISLIGLRLALFREHDGRLRLHDDGQSEMAGNEALEDLAADLAEPSGRDGLFARLERVGVRDGHLTVLDEATGLSWEASDADIDLDLLGVGLLGRLSFDLRAGALQTRLDIEMFRDRASGLSNAAVVFSDLNAARLAAILPEFEAFAGLDLPLSGKLSFGVTAAEEIDSIEFTVAGGAGTATLPAVFPAPVPVQSLTAAGVVLGDMSRITVEAFDLATDRPRFSLNDFTVWEEADGIGIRGRLEIADMPMSMLPTYWPKRMIPAGRAWILANVEDGIVTHIGSDIDIRPGELESGRFGPESVVAELAFQDVTIHYLRSMPPVTGVDGTGQLDGHSFDLAMSGGRVAGLDAHRGSATLTNIQGDVPRMHTAIEGSGPVANALELLDHPRLKLISRIGLTTAGAGGTVRTRFTVDMPLLMTLDPKEIQIAATAEVKDGELSGLPGGLELSKADLTVAVDTAKLDVDGDAHIQGMPATVAWQALFREDAPFKNRYRLSLDVTPEGRQALGIDLAPFAEGPLALDVELVEPGGEEVPHATVSVDATGARLEIPELFWVKPAGDDASLEALVEFPPGRDIALESITLDAEGLQSTGRAVLDAETGALRTLDIERLLHGRTDISAQIEITDRNPVRIAIAGKSLDVEPQLDRLLEEDAEDSPPFILDIDVRELILGPGRVLANTEAQFVNPGNDRHTGFLTGTLPNGGALGLQLRPMEVKRSLVVTSDDAGAVARLFDIYDNAVGGALRMEAVLHDDLPDGRITGLVSIEDYRVTGAPTLARLLLIATLSGLFDALQGEGISFFRFHMPFTIVGDTLTIEDAKTSGLSLGINADGTVDLETEEVDIAGTVVPAYVLNSFIGNIPILGQLLTGGEGEGLFAANYRVTGSMTAPEISVNPLSVLTPGFLRNLFTFLGDAAGEGEAAEEE